MTIKEIVKKIEAHFNRSKKPCAFYASELPNAALVQIGAWYDCERTRKRLMDFCKKHGFMVEGCESHDYFFKVFEAKNRLV